MRVRVECWKLGELVSDLKNAGVHDFWVPVILLPKPTRE
jgi:hypothetical protein